MLKYEVACSFCNTTTYIEKDNEENDTQIEYCPLCGESGVDAVELNTDNDV